MKYNICQTCGTSKLDRDNRFRKFCSLECRYKSQIGKPTGTKGTKASLETRLKQSLAKHRFYANGGEPWNKGKPFYAIRGDKHHMWKGGISPIRIKDMGSFAYKKWKKEVFKRDNYQCVLCGSKENLQADHIKMYVSHRHLKNDVSNGQTLCKNCHKEKTRNDLSVYFRMMAALRALEKEGEIERCEEVINGEKVIVGYRSKCRD